MENENASAYFSMLKGPKKTEGLLQKRLCQWMLVNYPGAVFRSGFEGLHLTEQQASQMSILNSHTGMPDLMIFERRGQYCGLCLELKKDGAPLYKKDGKTLRSSTHLANQQATLALLAARGWRTGFAQGLAQAQERIVEYMAL